VATLRIVKLDLVRAVHRRTVLLEPSSVLRCTVHSTSVVQYGICRRYTDTSWGARSRWQSPPPCAAPDSVTLRSRAPRLTTSPLHTRPDAGHCEVPVRPCALDRDSARPGTCCMLRYAMSKTIAVGKRPNRHSDSPELAYYSSSPCGCAHGVTAGAPPKLAGVCAPADWALCGFALNALDCALLCGWCLPPARHWPGLVGSHSAWRCAPHRDDDDDGADAAVAGSSSLSSAQRSRGRSAPRE
jgi:hypothetical protein